MAALPIEVSGGGRAGLLGMPATRFLRDYWQKRPLLVRNAFPDWRSPLTPEDLAGLACEELALARLIRYDRRQDRYSVQSGPFEESVFPALPQQDWTLLVQDVDKWDEDVRALLPRFDFLPSWRIDDVMISFAAPGGSVGAHTDHYDVFLIQGLGQRRWQIDARPDAPQGFRADSDLKLLAQFDPSHEWLLQPGDMLYLPPEVPHHGVAVDACLTLSVGMRAPSQSEMLGDLADWLERSGHDAQRYADPDLTERRHAGEIQDADLERARASLRAALQLPAEQFGRWFGEMVTRYRNSGLLAAPPKRVDAAPLAERLASGASLVRHPFTRLAWRRQGKSALLFALGQSWSCPRALAASLCEGAAFGADDWARLDADGHTVVLELLNLGHLAVKPAPRRRRS